MQNQRNIKVNFNFPASLIMNINGIANKDENIGMGKSLFTPK
jgi:hypothetical protein